MKKNYTSNLLKGGIRIKISVERDYKAKQPIIIDLKDKTGKLQLLQNQVPTSSQDKRPQQITDVNNIDRSKSGRHNQKLPADQKSKLPGNKSNLPNKSLPNKADDSKSTGRILMWDPNHSKIGDRDSPFCNCSVNNTKPEKKDNYACDICHTAHRFDCFHSIFNNFQEYWENIQFSSENIYCNECDLKLNESRRKWVKALKRHSQIPQTKPGDKQ